MALAAAVHIQDTRANQPAASAAYEGVLYIVEDEGYAVERCDGSTWIPLSTGSAGSSTVLAVLTADPASPADDTAWLFRDGGSPEKLEIHVRRSGVTVPFPIGDF